MTAVPTKRIARGQIDELLAGTHADQRLKWSQKIMERVLSLDAYARAQAIFCFASMPTEPQTIPLLTRMIDEGKQVYLPIPRVLGQMDAVPLRAVDELRRGKYGIMEPLGGEPIAPEALDLILLPGAAFDRGGGRLGRGGGFYDRYLASTHALTVGLAFELQLMNAVPRDAHDLPVQMVVTEAQIYFEGTTQ